MGIISSFLGGVLVDKIGAKKSLLIGFIVAFFSSILLLVTNENLILFILYSLIFGLGGGVVIGSPLKALIVEFSPDHSANSSVSLVSLFRSIGTSIGGVFAGFLFAHTNNSVDWLFFSSVIFCLWCITLSLFITKKEKTKVDISTKVI